MIIKNMSKRERYIAIGTISFLIIAVIYSFILDPVMRSWKRLNRDITSKSATYKKDLTILSSKKSIEDNYEKFAKYVMSERSEEETVSEVLSYLENLSRTDSCTLINIKPVGTKSYGEYKELLVELSAEGSLSEFSKFLYDVENTKNMILKVRHFVLTSKAGQEGNLNGNFLISKTIIE